MATNIVRLSLLIITALNDLVLTKMIEFGINPVSHNKFIYTISPLNGAFVSSFI